MLDICSAIDELPTYLNDVLCTIECLTGLSGSIIVGGPMPNANGAISSLSVHMGKNALGLSFGEAFQDYDTNILGPFQHFLRNVYRTCLHPFTLMAAH